MPILWPDIAWELIWESNKTIFWGEAVRLTDLPAGSWSGSGHLNRCHEAVDASPHPNGSVGEQVKPHISMKPDILRTHI